MFELFLFSRLKHVEELSEINLNFDEIRPSTKQVLSLETLDACNEEISGGKGTSLAQMITIQDKLNVEIPKGVVLTTNALENHLAQNSNIRTLLENLQTTAHKLCSEKDNDLRNEMENNLENQCFR